jgi:hypothetical protein
MMRLLIPVTLCNPDSKLCRGKANRRWLHPFATSASLMCGQLDRLSIRRIESG